MPVRIVPHFLRNRGGGHFEDATGRAGASLEGFARGRLREHQRRLRPRWGGSRWDGEGAARSGGGTSGGRERGGGESYGTVVASMAGSAIIPVASLKVGGA